MSHISDRNEFEQSINYTFNDKKLLKQALIHSSFSNERKINKLANNERLEFLGDAVLEVVTSEYIYFQHKDMSEGDLTKLRASIVCEPTLSLCAKEIHLGKYIALGKGEELTGGRNRDSILSDALEAVIGAIYLDGGFANAKEFIHKFILSDLENKQLFYDSKTILQEIIQKDNDGLLHYELIREEGPDHDKSFVVEAKIDEHKIGEGTGRTKKAAEQQAAYRAILEIKKNEKSN